ncbi:MAG: hypothetical protein HYX68_00655 [Planctomycetes bacterium]|nr:hypothetical protein [Planctomycetota bacterium]
MPFRDARRRWNSFGRVTKKKGRPLTADDYLKKRRTERKETFDKARKAGILVGMAAFLFGIRLCSWPFDLFICAYVKCPSRKEKQVDVCEWRLRQTYENAIDIYHLAWLFLLIFVYAIVVFGCSLQCCLRPWGTVSVLVGVLPLYRLGEIMAVILQLHISASYEPSKRTRAVIHAVMHFLEVALAFAVFYCVGDHFCSSSTNPMFADGCSTRIPLYSDFDFITPLYFSVVSLATLGYGDYAPKNGLGKILVMAQLFVQFVFILIVLPTIVSSQERKS